LRQGHRLTLLSASAGYGKTTLISEWLQLQHISQPAPPGPAWFNTVIRAFRSDFFYWGLLTYQRSTLLALLGLPKADQANLTPEQVRAVNQVIDEMLPFSPRGDGLLFDLTRLDIGDPYPVAQIQAPTLVVHARTATVAAFTHARFSATIPGAELLTLEAGGHFVGLIDQQVKTTVSAFLAQYNPQK